MIRQKTGVVLESFQLGIKGSIKAASALGFKGVQIDATQGDITPGNLSQTGRQDLNRIISSNKLCLCALGGELGVGFEDENEFDLIIKKIKKIINLALDLHTNVVTIQIGNIPVARGSSAPVCPALAALNIPLTFCSASLLEKPNGLSSNTIPSIARPLRRLAII